MEITLSAYLTGLLSAIVAELFKLFPALTKNQTIRSLTVIVVMIIGTLFSVGFDTWDWKKFGAVVIWSFVNYKLIVQPVANDLQLRSQA